MNRRLPTTLPELVDLAMDEAGVTSGRGLDEEIVRRLGDEHRVSYTLINAIRSGKYHSRPEPATVRVNRQLIGRAGPEPVFGPPKSKASVRTVPLPRHVVEALAKHLANYPAEPHELVFRTARGTPLTRTVFGRAWRPAAEVMGLPVGKGLHQLRHFYASLLIAAGRSPKEVQERLGHASTDEAMTVYVHLWHSADEGTRDAIDAAFGEPD